MAKLDKQFQLPSHDEVHGQSTIRYTNDLPRVVTSCALDDGSSTKIRNATKD